MIVFRDLVVQLSLMTGCKRQVLQWEKSAVPMKEPISLLGQAELISRKMSNLEMKTAELDST